MMQRNGICEERPGGHPGQEEDQLAGPVPNLPGSIRGIHPARCHHPGVMVCAGRRWSRLPRVGYPEGRCR